MAVDSLQIIPVERWADLQIQSLMKPIEPSLTIESYQPLLEVAKLLEEKKLPTLTVVRDNGILVGILEKASIQKLLLRRTQATPA